MHVEFRFYKQDIGDFFWLPAEAFREAYPDATVEDRDLTVLSLVFTPEERTREEQAAAEEPCLRWIYARNSWQAISRWYGAEMTALLGKEGIRALAPDMLPAWSRETSEKYGNASSWSHRHAAHVAGLGTFGLCDGLITRQGKAVRLNTLILEGKLEADERPYTDHHSWCLYYAKGTCKACIQACPAGAITEKGHDKKKCMAYMAEVREKNKDNPVFDPNVKFGCGLCQGKVPCQKGLPLGL